MKWIELIIAEERPYELEPDWAPKPGEAKELRVLVLACAACKTARAWDGVAMVLERCWAHQHLLVLKAREVDTENKIV